MPPSRCVDARSFNPVLRNLWAGADGCVRTVTRASGSSLGKAVLEAAIGEKLL